MQQDVTTHEAARLAASCTVIEQASSFGKWVQRSGPRAVTPSRVLRKPDVPDAAAAIGVQVPAKFRAAGDVPVIHRPWELALALELLQIKDGMVSAGPGLDPWPPDDETLVDAWFASLIAPDRNEHASITDADLLAVLMTMDNGFSTTDPRFQWETVSVVGPLIHEFRADSGLIWGANRVADAIARLELFGVIDGSAITPLGAWVAGRLRTRVAGPGPEWSPADFIAYLGTLPEDELYRGAWSWLDKQPDSLRAARGILSAASGMELSLRWIATYVVGLLGDEAVPVWREMLADPSIGPHAAYALSALDAGPEPTDTQWLWLAVESAARALAVEGPDAAVSVLWDVLPAEKLPVEDLEHRLAVVRATDHPSAQALADAVDAYVAESGAASLAVNQVLRLKVTLKFFRPPIWRTVLIPATAYLSELHRVIQVLFGWDGDHPHMFRAGDKQYANPFFGLEETSDESETRVEKALAAGKLSYEYDFGAGWTHEITLQRKLPRSPGAVYPACVKFGGDSPVEYPEYDDDGEYIGQEPEAFDLAATNQELAGLRA